MNDFGFANVKKPVNQLSNPHQSIDNPFGKFSAAENVDAFGDDDFMDAGMLAEYNVRVLMFLKADFFITISFGVFNYDLTLFGDHDYTSLLFCQTP